MTNRHPIFLLTLVSLLSLILILLVTPTQPTAYAQSPCRQFPQSDGSVVVECRFSKRVVVGKRFGRSIYRTVYYWKTVGVTPAPSPTPKVVRVTPSPSPTPKALSTPTPSKGTTNQKVEILANSLNVRSGPSTRFPIITKLPKGSVVEVTERKGLWYRVITSRGQGWIAAAYTKVIDQVVSANTSPNSITGFETWGRWRRGDERWGTFVQSDARQTSGRFAGKLEYDFPANEPNNYVVFRRMLPIKGEPTAFRTQVYGDGSTHFLNVWVQDAKRQMWQFSFGRITHKGWQVMEAPLDTKAGWPNQPIGNANTASPVYPIKFYALVLDGYTSDRSFEGSIYVDDLETVHK